MKRLWTVLFGLLGVIHASPPLKDTLRLNMTLVHSKSPPTVSDPSDLLSEGLIDARLRLNSFVYDNGDDAYDQQIVGLGGSLGFRSAYWQGLGFSAVAYTSQEILHGSMDDVSHYKAGKDVLSRYDAMHGRHRGIESLAQAFVEYRDAQSSLKVGRLLFESFLTQSNDTKMIPNAFEGVTFESQRLPDTGLKMALFTRQKLRDHRDFHHLLAYGDNPEDPYAKWSENDDSAMHRGLTLSRLTSQGIEDRLLVIELQNHALDRAKLKLNYTAVPELIASAMVEGSYQWAMAETKVIPAVRYMKQFDEGAGAIGGANLRLNTVGYTNPDSLDGGLVGLRMDVAQKRWRVRLGYTHIMDEGDIVAPWRGFPTGGYTRAMGQYNWYANTDTYMVQTEYKVGDELTFLSKVHVRMRYAIEDFDDAKAGVQSDAQVWTLDVVKKGFDVAPNLYGKFRVAHVQGDDETMAQDGTLKPDPSYNEARLEFNYLF